jgi:hypothetical protein
MKYDAIVVRRCSSCSVPCMATATPWMPSPASPPARSSPVEFFDPANIGRIMSAAT